MNKILSFIKSAFKEVGILFTDAAYRERMRKEFFYAIFYHWTALKFSIQSQLNFRYLIAAGVVLLIFVALQLGLQPYRDTIIAYLTSWLNPVLDTTDKTLDQAQVQDTNPGFGFFTIFSFSSAMIIAGIKGYYRNFVSAEALGYLFSFEAYKYIVITLARPVLADLIERVQNRLTGVEYTERLQGKSLLENYKRAAKLSVYSFGMQLLLTIMLLPLAPVSTFIISWYFTGVMLMDNYSRAKGLSAVESHKAAWMHKWFAAGTGMTFTLLNFIPFIGPIIAPVLSSVAAGIGLHEIEKEEKEALSNSSARDDAYYAAEKQAVDFGKDLNTGLDVGQAFGFVRTKGAQLRNGVFLNLLTVFSIWIMIIYFLVNFSRTSKLISLLFPLYKPEIDPKGDELATTISMFDSLAHFIAVFMVLFLFGFVFYRFLVFLLQTQNIYLNSLEIQKKNNPDVPPVPVDRISLLFNSFLIMLLEMFLMWVTLYAFLISSGYSLLLCLALFLIIDAILIGILIITSRSSFKGLSFSQKADILWQHKGFVLATGIVYLLGSYVPFAAMKFTPSLAITTSELGIHSIKMGQTIQYVKHKDKSTLKNNPAPANG